MEEGGRRKGEEGEASVVTSSMGPRAGKGWEGLSRASAQPRRHSLHWTHSLSSLTLLLHWPERERVREDDFLDNSAGHSNTTQGRASFCEVDGDGNFRVKSLKKYRPNEVKKMFGEQEKTNLNPTERQLSFQQLKKFFFRPTPVIVLSYSIFLSHSLTIASFFHQLSWVSAVPSPDAVCPHPRPLSHARHGNRPHVVTLARLALPLHLDSSLYSLTL